MAHIKTEIGDLEMQYDISGITNSGSALKENQDTFFIVQTGKLTAFGVFDGHGKVLGKLAATTAKDFFTRKFTHEVTFEDIQQEPEICIRKLFQECHNEIKTVRI